MIPEEQKSLADLVAEKQAETRLPRTPSGRSLVEWQPDLRATVDAIEAEAAPYPSCTCGPYAPCPIHEV